MSERELPVRQGCKVVIGELDGVTFVTETDPSMVFIDQWFIWTPPEGNVMYFSDEEFDPLDFEPIIDLTPWWRRIIRAIIGR